MDPPKRRWSRRLAALVIALVLALLAAEILVRLIVGSPSAERLPVLMMRANRTRGWEMVPGVHYTYRHPVHVNRLGLRGPELGAKAEDELRVLALGDSLIYGQGVGDDETVPHYLEAALDARDPRGRRWTVVNGGHRAFDTRQELALLADLAPAVQPDVVALFWYWNDLRERDIERTYENLAERGVVAFDTGNSLQGWDRVRWWRHELLRRSALVMYLWDARRRGDPLHLLGVEEVRTGYERLAGYLDRFVDASGELGFVPLVVAIPDANALLGPHQSTELDARALALAEERGIAAIRARPAIEPLYEERGRLPVIPYDGHYLPSANRAMAELVAERVLALMDG